MSILEAIILGILQGLTEFLPVSSSGHLELANYFFGIEEPNNLRFTAALHGATVLSTLAVFRTEIAHIFRGVLKFRMNDQTVFVVNILISMLPILLAGLFFREQVESLFTSNLLLVGSMLIVTAALLTFSHYAPSGDRPITPQRAFIIGIAQTIAIFPGLSRSGSTISAGLLQGVKRGEAAKFSFLMVIIPILGMNLLEVMGPDKGGATIGGGPVIAGSLAAFITGVLACRWMVKLVAKGKLIWFAAYCLAVGALSIITYLV